MIGIPKLFYVFLSLFSDICSLLFHSFSLPSPYLSLIILLSYILPLIPFSFFFLKFFFSDLILKRILNIILENMNAFQLTAVPTIFYFLNSLSLFQALLFMFIIYIFYFLKYCLLSIICISYFSFNFLKLFSIIFLLMVCWQLSVINNCQLVLKCL